MTSVKTKTFATSRPDEKLFKEKIEAVTKLIDEIKAKISEASKKIGSTSVGRDEFNAKRTEMRARLDELQSRDDVLETERKSLFTTIESKQKEAREIRSNAQNLKKSLGYTSEVDIDRKIAEIEELMMTSTISLKEEKSMIQQIAQLKSNKPLIGKYSSMASFASNSEDNTILPLKVRLDKIREELSEIRAAKKEENEKYKSLMEKRNSERGNVKQYIDEKEDLNRNLTIHIKKRRELLDQLRSDMDKYIAYQNQIAALKSERIKEERKKKAVEQEKLDVLRKLEKVDVLPLENEVLLVQQTLQYVQKLMDTQTGTDSSEQSTPQTKLSAGQDEEIILPKNQREEEFYFAPKAKKNANKKGAGKSKNKTKPLKLDIATISIFEQCGVSPPVTYDDLINCNNQLQEKLDDYKKQQQEKLEQGQEKRKDLQSKLDALEKNCIVHNGINLSHKLTAEVAPLSEEDDQ